MRLGVRLSHKLYRGRGDHSSGGGDSPVFAGYLFDMEGYALKDSEGYWLDTIN